MKQRSVTELVISATITTGVIVAWVYTAWINPLESKQYDDHATLSASVANITSLTSSISDIQNRVDWLSEQKGYIPKSSATSMADTTNETITR